MGVFVRGKKLWITYKDVNGEWKNASTGFDVGQEELAQRTYDDVVAGVRAATAGGNTVSGPPTVRAYAEQWIEDRRKLDLDWKNDHGRLRHHVLPVIGDMKVADVRTRHVLDLFRGIRTNTERPVAQRTVYNIYSVVSALFRDAKLSDLTEQTPCCLDERQLGPLVDKDPEWRAGAVFTREEAQTIISSPVIPFDRQVVYGLELLAGVRPGEGASLRWRHYDPATKPLGTLLVATAYNTRKHRAKATKTDAVRHVPVHATLAAMLAEWKLGGWAAMIGRAPTPDDLIVPLPPEAAARRRTRTGEPFRGHDYSGKRWRDEDLPALGWRHRQHYDMKATFITLALEDGADPHVIETRVTHTKKARSAFDGYNRGRQWDITCAEVVKLRLTRRVEKPAPVVPLLKISDEAPAPYSPLLTEFLTVAASDQNDNDFSWRRRESNPRPKMRP
jgi:integrase